MTCDTDVERQPRTGRVPTEIVVGLHAGNKGFAPVHDAAARSGFDARSNVSAGSHFMLEGHIADLEHRSDRQGFRAHDALVVDERPIGGVQVQYP